MTAPRLTVIPGGRRALTPQEIKEAATAIRQKLTMPAAKKRARNKKMMLDALQKMSIAIYRDDPYRAKHILEHVKHLINRTWQEET